MGIVAAFRLHDSTAPLNWTIRSEISWSKTSVLILILQVVSLVLTFKILLFLSGVLRWVKCHVGVIRNGGSIVHLQSPSPSSLSTPSFSISPSLVPPLKPARRLGKSCKLPQRVRTRSPAGRQMMKHFKVKITYFTNIHSLKLFHGRTRTAYLYRCVCSGSITPRVQSGVTKRTECRLLYRS